MKTRRFILLPESRFNSIPKLCRYAKGIQRWHWSATQHSRTLITLYRTPHCSFQHSWQKPLWHIIFHQRSLQPDLDDAQRICRGGSWSSRGHYAEPEPVPESSALAQQRLRSAQRRRVAGLLEVLSAQSSVTRDAYGAAAGVYGLARADVDARPIEDTVGRSQRSLTSILLFRPYIR